MAQQSPAALRIHTNQRSDFDSYFPVEEYPSNQEFDTDFRSLPFPASLTSLRTKFRDDTFDCDAFLLENQRHGQLDDLLLELRNLSKTLESELTRGVEDDYEDFIALGKIDNRKVGELRRGVGNIRDQLCRLQEDISRDLDEVEETMKLKANLRRRKEQARSTLRVIRTIDELSFFLHDSEEESLESAVDVEEYLQHLLHKVDVPESEVGRYTDLRDALRSKLVHAMARAHGDDKLVIGHMMRKIHLKRASDEESEE